MGLACLFTLVELLAVISNIADERFPFPEILLNQIFLVGFCRHSAHERNEEQKPRNETKSLKPTKNQSALATTTGRGWFTANARWIVILGTTLLLQGPAAAEKRPFQGSITGQFVAAPTQDPTVYVGGAQAVGKATHVGAFTKVTSDATDIATGAVAGSFTMTTANGDHVIGEYRGFIVFGSAPGSFSWVLNATITGGSGRFSSAIGEFVFIAAGAAIITDGVVYGKYTETFEGTIDY